MIGRITNNFKPFFKYCVVGAIGTFLDLTSLYIFVEYLNLTVLLGATFSFLIAVINNFLLNKFWTFQSNSKNYKKLFIKFLIVSTIGLGLTLSFMYLLADMIGIWYMFAKVITSFIVLIWNFLGNKLWTFRLHEKKFHIPKKYNYKFSIVIPAYNEENRIKGTLLIIDNYISSENLKAEIIVVSDGSTDGTGNIVNGLMKKINNLRFIEYKKNQGKGFAVKKGVENCLGEYILFADADNSSPIEELNVLFEKLKESGAEIAIGSRYLPSSNIKIKQPKYRIILGRLGNFLIRLFLIDNIKDTQCGFKLFTHRAAKEIFYFQKVKRFGFDIEALVVANSLGYKIVEVPVSWFNSSGSRVRPVKDAFRTLRDLVYIKLNLWSGRYFNDSSYK